MHRGEEHGGTDGFRAGELAALCPKDFNLDESTITLSATFTKNKRTAIQPLPANVSNMLRSYLEGKPAGLPVWPGTWHERAADMLRIDLDAVGIPYVIQGGEGPLYADFHCLRHSFVAMLDKSGATLKEAMQLARHSDPKLTMAVYGKARLHDLAGAMEKMPSLGSSPAMDNGVEELAATGTDGKPAAQVEMRFPFTSRAGDETCKNMKSGGAGRNTCPAREDNSQVLTLMGHADECGEKRKDE